MHHLPLMHILQPHQHAPHHEFDLGGQELVLGFYLVVELAALEQLDY
jgi:hypothetical protein